MEMNQTTLQNLHNDMNSYSFITVEFNFSFSLTSFLDNNKDAMKIFKEKEWVKHAWKKISYTLTVSWNFGIVKK